MIADERNYIPVCLNLKREKCLVIGGGKVAFRKVNILRKFDAEITCISPRLVAGLMHLSAKNEIKYIKSRYCKSIPLTEYKLVIAATDDLSLNQEIAARARKERVLVNAVNKQAKGDIILPAILRKKDVLIAVSTNGKNPSEAKKIRDSLKNVI